MNKRLLIVIASYATSSLGILLMLAMMVEELSSQRGFKSIVVVWLAAWVVHVVMSAAWVRNVRLPRPWPIAGLLFGAASCLVPYVVESTTRMPDSVLPSAAGHMSAIQLVLVFPCFLLALWLTGFHWRGRAPRLE